MRWFCLQTFLIWLLLGGPCSALLARADEAPEPAGYRDRIAEALREYEAGHHAESRALFLQAHALFPNARTHRGIAMTEFELRNYLACVAQIDQALQSTVRALDPRQRADAEQLRTRAQSFLARLTIDTQPLASALKVDGADTPVGAPVVLKLGEHVVEARAPGYAAETRSVSLKSASDERLTIVFGRPLATHAQERAVPRRRWLRSPWLWTAAGVLVAGAAVGTVLALRRGQTHVADFTGGSTDVVLTGPRRELR